MKKSEFRSLKEGDWVRLHGKKDWEHRAKGWSIGVDSLRVGALQQLWNDPDQEDDTVRVHCPDGLAGTGQPLWCPRQLIKEKVDRPAGQ